MQEFLEINAQLLEGFGVTCLIFLATLAIAIPLALPIALGEASSFKPLAVVLRVFVWIIRGTPLMLQLLAVYYGPALLFDWGFLQRIQAVILAFSINYACYFAEIYRGGIQSVSKGQYEAGFVLGMTRSQVFFRVILLQTVKRILAPMSNEIITLVKDTSLARIIVVEEILKVAYNFTAQGLIWPLFFTGVYYLVFVGVLTLLFGYLEKKLDYFKS